MVRGRIHLHRLVHGISQLLNDRVFPLKLGLHLRHPVVIGSLMDRVSCSLLEEIFHDGPLPQALLAVSLYLLLHLLRLCVPDVLSQYFELLISLHHLILEFSDLLLQRHHEEGLLLVLLSGLRKRKQALV